MQFILFILVNISYCVSNNVKEKWYKVTFKSDANDWTDLRLLEDSIQSAPLSTHYNSFAERQFDFKFPFYEEKLQRTLATTQGFLYMGSAGNTKVLYETQYISPLMAGFRPSTSPQDVRHFSNGSVYINQWSDMSLELQRDVGVFTFQVQLHCDGVIKFIYRQVPLPIARINDTWHHVKVGVSDAYSEQRDGYTHFSSYDTLDLDITKITSNSTYILTPNPTCGSQKSCKKCYVHSPDCLWCPALYRCSTREGVDKYYKLWQSYGCGDAERTECNATSDLLDLPITYNCAVPTTATPASTPPRVSENVPIIPLFTTKAPAKITTKPTEKPNSNTAGMTIITTISVTAICIAAVLVIAAVLLLKLRKPVVNLIKLEPKEPCTENCRTLLDHHLLHSRDTPLNI